MDKMIFTAFNTLNNIYDNRSVRAQNMANVNVPGYRRDIGTRPSGVAFMDNFNTLQSRALPIRDDLNYFEETPGTLSATASDLDVAVRGAGYFAVKGPGAPSLTRRGDLTIDADGFLVNGSKHQMLNQEGVPIEVPPYRSARISDDGAVIIEPVGSEPGTQVVVDRLGIVGASELPLKKFPDGEVRAEDGSLPPIDPSKSVVIRHMELSNVNITEELVNTIEDQRQYEINIKLLTSAKEADEAGASLMRLPS